MKMTIRPKITMDSVLVDQYFDHCDGYFGVT